MLKKILFTCCATMAATVFAATSLAQQIVYNVDTPIEFHIKTTTYSIPHFVVTASSLSAEQWQSFFNSLADPNFTQSWRDIRAGQIKVDQLQIIDLVNQGKSRSCTGVVLKGVDKGRIEDAQLQHCFFDDKSAKESTDDDHLNTLELTDITFSQLDIALISDFFMAPLEPEQGVGERKLALGSFKVGRFEINQAALQLAQNNVSVKSVKLSPAGLGGCNRPNPSPDAPNDVKEAKKRNDMGCLSHLIEGLSVDDITFGELRALMHDKNKTDEVVAGWKTLGLSGLADGNLHSFLFEGISAQSPDLSIKIDQIYVNEFIGAPLAELFHAYLQTGDEKLLQGVAHHLPTVEHVGFKNAFARIDQSKPQKADQQERQTIEFTYGLYDLQLNQPINGLPSHLREQTDHLTFDYPEWKENFLAVRTDLPKREKMKIFQSILKDIEKIDYSDLVDLHWSEAKKVIELDPVRFSLKNLLNVNMSLVLGGASTDLFSRNQNVEMAAVVGMNFDHFTLDIRDGGQLVKLSDFLLSSPEDKDRLKQDIHLKLTKISTDWPGASDLEHVLDRFIDHPASLSISVTPKEPLALTAIALISMDHWQAMLNKLNITARAD